MSAVEDERPASQDDRTFRCSICSHDWPPERKYARCPGCEEKTTPFSHTIPMDAEEAESLRLHYEFDKFYEQYDAAADPARLRP